MPPPDDNRKDLARRVPPARGDVVHRAPPRRTHDDDEGPIPQDLERFNSVIRTCPHCKGEAYDDIRICPHCHRNMDAPPKGRPNKFPVWVAITGAILLAAFILSTVRGFR